MGSPGSTDEASVARFTLDSGHLAMLDRFIARASRHARRNGRQFSGVVVEIDTTRPVRIHAADLEPLVLRPEPCITAHT
jgi:hypothetical protein